MALDNFIPSIWSARVQLGLEKNLVAVRLANRSYEGEIRMAGDRVKVNSFADPTITAYTKNVTTLSPEILSAAQREILINQSYSFNFEVDDVDAAQMNVDLQSKVVQRAGYKLADTADAYILGLYATAGNARHTAAAPVDLVSTNIEEEILAIGEAMDIAGVEKPERFLCVAPWVHTKMVLAGLTTKLQNDVLWENGFVGRILGFNVYVSANVYKTSSTTWAGTANLAGVANESLAYAEQIVSVFAYRPENAFSDAVKGLHLYGAKIIRPDKTWVWYADYTAEA